MEKQQHIIKSNFLRKDIEIMSYGHYGLNLLFFKNEKISMQDCNLIFDSIKHFINIGRYRIYIVETCNNDSWNNLNIEPLMRSKIHFDFNNFIEEEVTPFIYNQSGGAVPIITCGIGSGAYHATNTFFRRPDIFLGTIGINGFYNIQNLCGNYFDDNCYYNSPLHYLPNLNDNYWLSYLLSRKHIYLISGSAVSDYTHETQILADVLSRKGIRNNLEIWGEEWDHSINTWVAMFKNVLENKL